MAPEPSPPPSHRPLLIRALLMLAALAALTWQSWPDGRFHVIFPAVEGDAVLLRTPAGGFVLIDGGADPAALAAALGRRMPYWQRHLDAVVLTHPDAQRLPAQVAALARYQTTLALASPATTRSAAFAEWRRLLREHAALVRVAQPGARLRFSGVTLTVLATDDEGTLLRAEYGATCVLLAHAPPTLEIARTHPCDLLAFPWELDPRTPLVESSGARHILFTDGEQSDTPPELTYAERAIGGARLYHERLNGTVEWVSDGRNSWVFTDQ